VSSFPSGRAPAAPNPFIRLILGGRISSVEELKRSYRRIVMKTHPDALGSQDRTDEFVAFSSYYEEAKDLLFKRDHATTEKAAIAKANSRLQFFQKIERLETLDMPYAFHRDEHRSEIRSLRREAEELFHAWNPDKGDMYKDAERQHQRIWSGKPSGPYLKHALALNIRPVLHNVIAFHLTGRAVYKRQARQNIKAIMSRLEEEGYTSFRAYLSLLIHDMENGPALFD